MTLVVSNANNLQAETETRIEERVIYGWVEWVAVEPSMMPAKAKLDTGAKTSSLHAKNIEWFEKDGKDWVRFHFSPNTKLTSKRLREGKSKNFVTIEAPVYRTTLIKQHKRSSVERPVILHKFMLDDREYETEFTLTDRSRFIYPVLLGRRFLESTAIVDPAHTYLRTQPPVVAKQEDKKAEEPGAQAKDTEKKDADKKDNDKKAEPPASNEGKQQAKAEQTTTNAAGKSDTP